MGNLLGASVFTEPYNRVRQSIDTFNSISGALNKTVEGAVPRVLRSPLVLNRRGISDKCYEPVIVGQLVLEVFFQLKEKPRAKGIRGGAGSCTQVRKGTAGKITNFIGICGDL